MSKAIKIVPMNVLEGSYELDRTELHLEIFSTFDRIDSQIDKINYYF